MRLNGQVFPATVAHSPYYFSLIQLFDWARGRRTFEGLPNVTTSICPFVSVRMASQIPDVKPSASLGSSFDPSFYLTRFDRASNCRSACFLLSPDSRASDSMTSDNPLPTNLTPGTVDIVLRSVQRIDDFMTGGRSGTMDQTFVNQAKREAHAAHEAHLQQIGADLHDGPAQLLALALLRFDALDPEQGNPMIMTAAALIRDAVTEALREVRNISVGLVLPELDRRSAAATVRLAVENYQRRTGCQVTLLGAGEGASVDTGGGRAYRTISIWRKRSKSVSIA
jgi:signal transduction histidine kinase